MRIYQVNVEHKESGTNWRNFNVAKDDFEEARKEAYRKLKKNEKIEDLVLIAEAD